MQPYYGSCKQWHARGPRVQQYLLYSNSHLNILVYVFKLCCDLAVFFCGSIKFHLITPGSCYGEDTCWSLLIENKTKKVMLWVELVCVRAEQDPARCFHVLCQKKKTKKTKNDDHEGKICRDQLFTSKMLSYTQLF